MFCPFSHTVPKSRGHVHPLATDRPGPRRVSPGLLPEVECRPQVAHCPVFRKNPASGANCEAATDVGIHTGRRLDKVAGEKARQTRPLPVRAEARLTSQIFKSRGHVRPWVTGRPGSRRVSPGLLPGAEYKPQIAHCPAFRKKPASGASCEAATDASINGGRRVIQIAGEKARQTRVTPIRAEVRLVSQIFKGRDRVCPWATGRPGLRRVSPGLLPEVERKPQVAHCPVFRKKPASGANCEAATDAGVGCGRRVIEIAGEKARQTRIIPCRAEVRLAPQMITG